MNVATDIMHTISKMSQHDIYFPVFSLLSSFLLFRNSIITVPYLFQLQMMADGMVDLLVLSNILHIYIWLTEKKKYGRRDEQEGSQRAKDYKFLSYHIF